VVSFAQKQCHFTHNSFLISIDVYQKHFRFFTWMFHLFESTLSLKLDLSVVLKNPVSFKVPHPDCNNTFMFCIFSCVLHIRCFVLCCIVNDYVTLFKYSVNQMGLLIDQRSWLQPLELQHSPQAVLPRVYGWARGNRVAVYLSTIWNQFNLFTNIIFKSEIKIRLCISFLLLFIWSCKQAHSFYLKSWKVMK